MIVNLLTLMDPSDVVSDRRLRVPAARLVANGMRMTAAIGKNVVTPESAIGSGR